MEWVTTIFSFIGSGWGSFAAILAGGVLIFFLKRWWTKVQNKASDKATKDAASQHHQQGIISGQKAEDQANKASDKADKWANDKLKKKDPNPN